MDASQISGWELWQWSQQARTEARAAEIAPGEVDWFLQQVTYLDHLALRLESFKTLSQIGLKRPWCEITSLWQRRLSERVPLQYLSGIVNWRHFSLKVSPAVLIPRPETELMIDWVAQAVAQATVRSDQGLTSGDWVDLGTGSGAIAFGLAQVLPNARIHAVDCSAAALDVARQNAEALQMSGQIPSGQIRFYQGDWWEPLVSLQGQVSGMVSNPPYIPQALIPTLQPEVAQHEPHLALAGGADGLDCIRHLVETAPTYVKSGGVWLVEMMAGQAGGVTILLQEQGSYSRIQILSDLAGIERFVLAYLK
ncbi:MAG: peptide chain release factor N(5)-glutamine methyltransferase [Oscillatoriales cyanobacterium RM1_1_9]|nr:peptide chain release factor N(5)-glutamine methyltransferase [Oscillatoriales cyanobacterium SM2_3_0]NJO46402.1 peptide chain release factor N(5)-glutamine methyltransferase [Oscillatoriales cyanobacterium RM2_1_1]NJO72205.1 peptide chain release factor N(5)-glutamine methyltransferase [Oscillatoriales cyanobacterium RM1_1_9]